ncbi:MAG: phosphoglycerate kinase [Betaproteobacteria bacterium AqS2]|uniref:Phosphoglycerate kinase n=1 Tax=Candidatus Amphirhobacter heronislandensis TaxID=1732024 RepID=A0A930UBJ4_9GAMM|nr:phosphoglycerate kinase [Betaproteobacteria bacterium AqS2]
MQSVADLELAGKAAIVRADLNVPLDGDGRIADASRLTQSCATFRHVLDAGAGLAILSHLGRPKEGEPDPKLSLAPVAAWLAQELGIAVPLTQLADSKRPAPGEAILLENTRFNKGEKANAAELAQAYAKLGDVFVMDAFASAHRSEASTVALAACAGAKCAGLLLAREVDALQRALARPERPVAVVIGGAKVSSKLQVLEKLAELADHVVVGGGIANTFLLAQGLECGKSLAEPDMTDDCKRLLERHGDKFLLPEDVVVAPSFDAEAGEAKDAGAIGPQDMVLDLGPRSAAAAAELAGGARTVIWNGALGVFENPAFSAATRRLAEAVAAGDGYSLAGGGETLAAINRFGVAGGISYLSTGGGAFLEFAEGRELPGIAALG